MAKHGLNILKFKLQAFSITDDEILNVYEFLNGVRQQREMEYARRKILNAV